jgi:hypothetical protein
VAQIDTDVTSVRTVEGRDWLFVPNGCPYELDSAGIVEQGFHWYPEDVKVISANPGAGSISGDISFAVVAHWEDDAGNSHWSAPAFTEPMTFVNVTGFTFRIGTLTLTRKPNIRFYVYRTDDDGKAYYLIGTVANNVLTETVTLTNIAWTVPSWAGYPFATASSLQGAGPYTDGGLLEDVQPPAYRIACMHQGRLFFVHREFESDLILYSKEAREKTATGINEILQLWVSPEGGRITGLESLGGRLIIFKAGKIFAVDGVGLTEGAQGPGYSRPYLLSPNLGCTNQKSIVKTPQGLLFDSGAGIQLLTQQMQIIPIGRRVKEYTDANDVSAAVLLPDDDSVLFVFETAGVEALLYNWRIDQWSTWTNSAASDVAVIDNVPWLRSTDHGVIVSLGSSTYIDVEQTHVSMMIETGWMHFKDLEGFKHLHEVLLAGYNEGAHKLQIKIAYDLDPVWVDTLTRDASAVTFDYTAHYGDGLASSYIEGAHLVEFIGSRKKFNTVRFQIKDIAGTTLNAHEARVRSIPPSMRDILEDNVARFGQAISFDGTRIAVGAYSKWHLSSETYPGAVYIFSSDGDFIERIDPQVADQSTGADFGISVALDGDWLIVGVPGSDVVCFYEWTGAGFTFRQRIAGTTTAGGDNFGSRVDIDGATAIVSAEFDDDEGANSGTVFIFGEAGGVWAESQIIQPEVTQANQQFGYAISVDETPGVLVISAQRLDDAETDEGKVYIYEESGGTYSLAATLANPHAATTTRFGDSVATDGTYVLVGMSYYDNPGDPANGGMALVYDKSGGSWAKIQEIVGPASTSANAQFGSTVRLDGSTYALVGAYSWENHDPALGTYQGAAFLYKLNATTGLFELEETIFPQYRSAYSEQGYYGFYNQGVAISGTQVVLGGRLGQPPTEPWTWGSDGPGVIRLYNLTTAVDNAGCSLTALVFDIKRKRGLARLGNERKAF